MATEKKIPDDIRLRPEQTSWSPTLTYTSSSNIPLASARSPLSRRRSIGESGTVDTPGYWVHVISDAAGIPKSAEMFEVADDMQFWSWLGSDERRILDRLPRSGVFIFLW